MRSSLSIKKSNTINIVLLAIFFMLIVPISYYLRLDPTKKHWQYVGLFALWFVIIGFLILSNRKNLENYNIDRVSLILFFLFGTIFRVRQLDNFITLLLELFVLIFTLALWVFLKKSGDIKTTDFHVNKWYGISFVFGIAFVILITILNPNNYGEVEFSINFAPFTTYFIKEVIIQTGVTGIIEEPIYRGFLWGTLRNLGWNNYYVLIFQAILFWISHLNYLNSPFTFWVTTPLIGVILGFLAMKSKSIVPPLIAHVVINAVTSAYWYR